MNEYQRRFPQPETVVALPPDLLGMLLLRWFIETGEVPQRDMWTQAQSLSGLFGLTEATELHELGVAFAEAWAWLERLGLLVPGLADKARDGVYLVTRRGRDVASSPDGPSVVKAVERAVLDLHGEMAQVRPQLLLGEYDVAVFVGMRSVEHRIRFLAGLDTSLVGRKLVSEAFKDGGRLRFPPDDEGEADGVMHLFMGAMGAFKNPTSHRVLAFDDAALASEATLLANLLHRVLDRIQAHFADIYAELGGWPPWVDLD